MKIKIAALALSAASLTGLAGTALSTPASASAPDHSYIHYAATYSSLSQCNTYRAGSVNSIHRHGYVMYSLNCKRLSSGGYTYNHIIYKSWGGPAISGDRAWNGVFPPVRS